MRPGQTATGWEEEGRGRIGRSGSNRGRLGAEGTGGGGRRRGRSARRGGAPQTKARRRARAATPRPPAERRRTLRTLRGAAAARAARLEVDARVGAGRLVVEALPHDAKRQALAHPARRRRGPVRGSAVCVCVSFACLGGEPRCGRAGRGERGIKQTAREAIRRGMARPGPARRFRTSARRPPGREALERPRLRARLGLHDQVAEALPKIDDVVHARLIGREIDLLVDLEGLHTCRRHAFERPGSRARARAARAGARAYVTRARRRGRGHGLWAWQRPVVSGSGGGGARLTGEGSLDGGRRARARSIEQAPLAADDGQSGRVCGAERGRGWVAGAAAVACVRL